MMFSPKVLPHETLNMLFENGLASSKEYIAAEARVEEAYRAFDRDPSQLNASKILAALTMVEVEKTKVRFAIVNRKDLRPASAFMKEIRHT